MENGIPIYPDQVYQVDIRGFTISVKEKETRIGWGDIKKLYAFKTDKLTYDSICLEVVYGPVLSLIVYEETEGWGSLVEGVKSYLPAIS